jgi:diaminopimelate decarboxylase
LTVGGLDVREVAREFGTPAYVVDEDDFRSRAREFQQAFDEVFRDLCGGADVYYAGKAFLCTSVARWVHEEGLGLDVCSGGELAVAIRAGFPGGRIGFHGNNKSVAEIEDALRYGVGRIVVDSFEEIGRVVAAAERLGVVAAVLVRVTVGVEAHTHEYIATAHEDQKFGFSLAGGEAAEAVRRILKHPAHLSLLGLHSHIGSQIFDTSGFEVATRRVLALHLDVAREHDIRLTELDLGGGFGVAYTTQHDPLSPRDLAVGMAQILERECRAEGVPVPRISIEPGRAIAGPSTFTLYEVGTIKTVRLDGDASRTYVSVDGGMSDNVRRRSMTPTTRARSPIASVRRAPPWSGSSESTARVAISSSRTSSCLQTSGQGTCWPFPSRAPTAGACPASTNHVPRPPVVAVRGGAAREIVRRERIEDLLALDAD